MSLKPLLSVTLTAAIALAARLAQAEDAAEPEPDILDAPYPKRAHLALRFGAGPSFESIASTALFGAHGSVSLGADTKVIHVFGTISGGGGKTDGGLDFYEFSVGPDLEWPLGPVRLGLRPRAGYLAIARATESELMEDMRAGIGGLFAVDFFRENGFVIGLEAEPRIDAAIPGFALFDKASTYPIYGLRLNFVVKRRMPRAGDEPAPRIGAAF
ncbi:MAG: hypothetical protein HOV80_30280 [Polyangiaceae bacterium]|nr:hypothetical protein [Polyangiaceae bacterium]